MKLLSQRRKYGASALKFIWLFIFSLFFTNMRLNDIAQATNNDIFPSQTCQQLASDRYAVFIDRPVNQLPRLPEFIATSVYPCRYFTTSMTYLGSFEDVNASIYLVSQIRKMGLDAVIHSFSSKNSEITKNFRANALLVEVNANPTLDIQQVRMLTGKSSFWAIFNNRYVILSAPLSSEQTVNILANNLRRQGFAVQAIDANLIADSNPLINTNSDLSNPLINTNSDLSNPLINTNSDLSNRLAARTSSKTQTVYQVLIPLEYNKNLKQSSNIIDSNSFQKIVGGRYYLQVRSYRDLGNAIRERERLNKNFSGVVIMLGSDVK